VQDRNPEIVTQLAALMEKYVAEGRSTRGAPQSNTTPVDLWNAGKQAHQPLKRP
jgi:hypothetical protein